MIFRELVFFYPPIIKQERRIIMKTLYIECNMGASGDMLMGALLEIYGDRQKFTDIMNGLGIDGVNIKADDDIKCGIKGTRVRIYINGEEEGMSDCHEHHEHHDHHDHHDHHEHHHHHASYKNILNIIDELNIPDKVKTDAKEIYKIIGEAESYVHGTDIENIHFHEVGTLDAVADVIGNCLLMNMINPERVVVSSINTGSGTVRCAHGILPVPAPAVSKILEGVPIYAGDIESELCTPTGAAILKYYSDEFSKMPVMLCEKTGIGTGTKNFDTANCVRIFLGETKDLSDSIVSLQCNVDDMTGEAIGYATEVLFNMGALEVFTVPIYMKKNRPGIMLICLCKKKDKEKFINLIFQETTTRGIRFLEMDRCVMDSEFFDVDTEFGKIKVKRSHGGGIEKCKPEYESVKAAAQNNKVSFEKVYNDVLKKM